MRCDCDKRTLMLHSWQPALRTDDLMEANGSGCEKIPFKRYRENIMAELENWSPARVKTALDNGEIVLIDVRTPQEYMIEHVEGSLLMPMAFCIILGGTATMVGSSPLIMLNDLLLRLGLIGQPLAWTADPDLTMAAVVLADVWKTTPFMAL